MAPSRVACLHAPRLQPVGDVIHQRVAQAGMLDAFHRLADEGLDQQRLRFLGRDAARLQVEQQILVEIARGRAVAALHVVGENLQFRLVVGFGGVRQQQRMGRHLGVGLLRFRAHDDLALEDAARLAVEHGLEQLSRRCRPWHGMIGDDRHVGVLAALEQARAADARRSSPSPSNRRKSWLRTTVPPVVNRNSLKRAARRSTPSASRHAARRHRRR